MKTASQFAVLSLLVVLIAALASATTPAPPLPSGEPFATVDLTTSEGARLVNAQWRYSDTRIVETTFRAPGADGQPGADPIRTYDYEPHAGAADFEVADHRARNSRSAASKRTPVLQLVSRQPDTTRPYW